MKRLAWIVRFLIPFAVLYTIGYFMPGFSALTISWLLLLTVLIMGLNWLILKLLGTGVNRLAKLIITFLVAAAVIFTVTQAIEGGDVPLGGALLAAGIIALLTAWLTPRSETANRFSHLR